MQCRRLFHELRSISALMFAYSTVKQQHTFCSEYFGRPPVQNCPHRLHDGSSVMRMREQERDENTPLH